MRRRTAKAKRRERQEAIERRIVRLALLLLANEVEAVRLIGPVLGLERAGADLGELELPNVDRLVVLRAREVRAGKTHEVHAAFPGEAGALLRALHELPGQAMEAFIFGHVERHDLRRVSRTMDCSTTAIGRHLESAEAELAARFKGDLEAATAALHAAYEAFDPMPAIQTVRAGAVRRRRRRRWMIAVLLAIIVVAVILAWLAL